MKIPTLILFVELESEESMYELQDMRELALGMEGEPVQFAYIPTGRYLRLERAWGIGARRRAVVVDHSDVRPFSPCSVAAP